MDHGIDLPSDCERESLHSHSLCRGDMEYIDQQISQAVEVALNTLSKAMADTKTSNVEAFRNVALQLAIGYHSHSDTPLTSAQVVESARNFHSFLKGWEA